jgi:DEAD/DEAH box helicase domain-containing protein
LLPATLALEVKKQVLHYLGATFNLRRRDQERALDAFFNDPERGLFKGPWLQVRRPFRLAADGGEGFFDIPIPFTPFKHQRDAWSRLTTRDGHTPQHTLVITGTGSGKTECFLYPILDHCLRMHKAGERDGIKAIVLYPMNALAADQAGRFAEEILTTDGLSYAVRDGGRKARVRVGLYTGRMSGTDDKGEGNEKGTYREVTLIPAENERGKPAYTAITNRQAMQEDPPDILLTNYKMLDYLLLRPKDTSIWRHNQQRSELLRYLVLDELHTYDGAQGSDVACLMRRLKARFDIPRDRLCVVGTSATVAGGDDESTMDPVYRLCAFAGKLFEEEIPAEAVLTEDRLKVEEIARAPFEVEGYPEADACQPLLKEGALAYAQRMAAGFGGPDYPLAADDPW